MMAARSQYPMSNIQYPILKSDPAESFYVLRKTGPKFLRSVENIRKVFTFYVKIAQSFYVLRKNRVGTALRAVWASRPSPWTLVIGHWLLDIPSSLPARGRAGSIPPGFGAPDDLVGGGILNIPSPFPSPLTSEP